MNNEQTIVSFNERINELWTATKRGELPRQARFAAIERLANEYIAATGKRPESEQLDRLATLCLYEETSDKTPYKIANDEYPIMNERMIDNRKARDTSIVALERQQERQLTGKRRKRSPYENSYLDRRTKSRDAKRRKKYREFIKTQPIIQWNIYE